MAILLLSCQSERQKKEKNIVIPRGYMSKLEINQGGKMIRFGPFVGYYFKPHDPEDITRLSFVCFNEKQYYTRDIPENAKLFEGEAVMATLPDLGIALPKARDAAGEKTAENPEKAESILPAIGKNRINPVFFTDAPEKWKATRPKPEDLYVHFHSCYDSQGSVHTGFWVRHEGVANFTYDMGGRVSKESPLYHRVTPGPDREFARVLEFDRGP